jgi:hypothetical protein
VATNGAGEGPYEQTDDRDEREAAGDAVCELDHGVETRRVLYDGAIAKRPMGATACA